MECRASVDQGYQWRVLIEVIDQHSTSDAFRTHDPNSLFAINGSGLRLIAIS